MVDAVIYLSNNARHNLSGFRDDIKRKWKSEKVFGPEHDNEVSLFRTLKELITKKLFEPTTENGVRDPNYYHLTDKA